MFKLVTFSLVMPTYNDTFLCIVGILFNVLIVLTIYTMHFMRSSHFYLIYLIILCTFNDYFN